MIVKSATGDVDLSVADSSERDRRMFDARVHEVRMLEATQTISREQRIAEEVALTGDLAAARAWQAAPSAQDIAAWRERATTPGTAESVQLRSMAQSAARETTMKLGHGEATDKGDHFWYIGTCGAAVTSETIPEIVRLATERGKPVKADVNGVAVTAHPGCHVEGLAKAWLATLDSKGDVVGGTWWTDVNFLCPECANINQWGSSRQADGSFRRSCHGHVVQPDGSGKVCRFSWPAADDARWLKNRKAGDAWAVPDAPAAKTVTIHADALKPGAAVVVTKRAADAKRPVFPAQPTSGGHVSQLADNEFRWVEAPSAKPGDVAATHYVLSVDPMRAGGTAVQWATVDLTPQAAALRAALSTIDTLTWSAADKRALRDAAHAVAEMVEATDGKAPAALRGPVTETLAALASAAHVGPAVIGEATKARDAARAAMGRRK